MFLTIEGPDGVGKTTIIKLLKEKFPEVLFIREPGTTLAGEKIREILLHIDQKLEFSSELLLFVTSFIETSVKIIKPALEQNRLVIADRWFYSTIAYQCFALSSSVNLIEYTRKKEFLEFLLYTTPVLKPDKNLILMASWEKILERLSHRQSLDKMESKSLEFKKRVYEYYKTKCQGEIVNTDCSIEETLENILKLISKGKNTK